MHELNAEMTSAKRKAVLAARASDAKMLEEMQKAKTTVTWVLVTPMGNRVSEPA